MKFAKRLQEELYPDWIEQYIDYKMMKKVLKQEDDGGMHIFHSVFEKQLSKVHEFMVEHQEEIIASISPLELDLGSETALQAVHGLQPVELNNHCEHLVNDIRIFQDYASLNLTAIRKIIKKFDKRFHMRFHDMFGQPTKKILVTDRDIGMWLLFPAQQCLKLMGSVVARSSLERPLRQYNFWVEELRAGSLIARKRFMGCELGDPTQLRLVMRGNPDELNLCIKNTFIDGQEEEFSSPTARRAASVPSRSRGPHLVLLRKDQEPYDNPRSDNKVPKDDSSDDGALEDDALSLTSVATMEHFICQTLNMAPPPGVLHSEVYNTDDEEDDVHRQSQRLPTASSTTPSRISPRSNVAYSEASSSHCRALQEEDRHSLARAANGYPNDQGYTPASSSSAGCQPAYIQQPSMAQMGRQQQQPQRRGRASNNTSRPMAGDSRWWTQATFSCPVSGFPISMLPYPPYKFSMRTKEPPLLVDGPYVVLQVLSTWNWDVLGRPLLVADVSALDAYMKRCKLGPYRLGKALELLSTGTPEALRELENLRAEARRKFDNLRHVQKVRRQPADQEEEPLGNRKKRNPRT